MSIQLKMPVVQMLRLPQFPFPSLLRSAGLACDFFIFCIASLRTRGIATALGPGAFHSNLREYSSNIKIPASVFAGLSLVAFRKPHKEVVTSVFSSEECLQTRGPSLFELRQRRVDHTGGFCRIVSKEQWNTGLLQLIVLLRVVTFQN